MSDCILHSIRAHILVFSHPVCRYLYKKISVVNDDVIVSYLTFIYRNAKNAILYEKFSVWKLFDYLQPVKMNIGLF